MTEDHVTMPTQRDIADLVEAHGSLDEPMDGAIWLNQGATDAWLLEVMPEIPEAAEPYPPFVFGPSVDFRFGLHLVAGPEASLARAIQAHGELSALVSRGEIIADSEAVRRLVELARQVTGA